MSKDHRIIEINDINAPELDIYARLNETQLRHFDEPNGGIFIAESPKVILRALDAGYEPISMMLEKKHITQEAAPVLERVGDIPIYTEEFDVLKNITGFQLTRGALCAMKRRVLPCVEEVCRGAGRIAILEDVENPTNVGAIFRSAAALGIGAVLLTDTCADPLYRRAARVAMGTVFQVPWTYLEGRDTTAQVKALGYRTVALALRKDTLTLGDPKLRAQEKLAIILGAEGDGLRDETIDACDWTVKIPMGHGVDSLNVAAASAVAFWELCKAETMGDADAEHDA
ncbi:MAG: RNA methyltransferase [Lachnospiraceae bacterium]|nr:RNA methyltransferase [Lachnospiraceae bacterium]